MSSFIRSICCRLLKFRCVAIRGRLRNRPLSSLFHRASSLYTELIGNYEVHETKLSFSLHSIGDAKVVPLSASFGIDIILHVEFIGRQRNLRITHSQ
jgi:hypothetical protein